MGQIRKRTRPSERPGSAPLLKSLVLDRCLMGRGVWPGRDFAVHLKILGRPLDNKLLAALPRREFNLLAPHLSTIPLKQGEVLAEPGDEFEQIYFPESGMLSLLAVLMGRPLKQPRWDAKASSVRWPDWASTSHSFVLLFSFRCR